jgi:hypothetical protein
MTAPAKRTRKRPSSNGSGANPEQGDEFRLNENGTVRVRWRDHNVLLWTPLVGEYEQILLNYSEGRDWYAVEGRSWQDAYSTAAPNAGWWELVIDLLGDNEDPIGRDQLASWMLTGDSIEKLIVHWRVNPLARGETKDLIQQVASNVVEQWQASATTTNDSSPAAPSPESEAS